MACGGLLRLFVHDMVSLESHGVAAQALLRVVFTIALRLVLGVDSATDNHTKRTGKANTERKGMQCLTTGG
eukprot:3305905-Amphidinium_carterae.1